MWSRRLPRLLAALFALSLLAAACSDDGDDGTADDDGSVDDDTDTGDDAGATTEPPATTATVPEGGVEISGVALTEVVFGADGHVGVTNDGAEEVTLDGLWLCNQPAYTPLSGTLAPGESVQVPASELGDLPIAGGAAALYTSDDFSSSDDMIDFVQWGEGGGREGLAVDAGLWDEGFAVEPDPEFGSIERFEISGGPGAWE